MEQDAVLFDISKQGNPTRDVNTETLNNKQKRSSGQTFKVLVSESTS